MASKWSEMTEEEKAVIKAKNKEYRYKRKAKELGISVEEYTERVEAKKAGKSSKEAGLINVARTTKVSRELQDDLHKLVARADTERVDKDGWVLRGGHNVLVLFKNGDYIVASFPRETPVEGQRGLMYFVNMKTMKRRPLMREDYKKTAEKRNAAAIDWARAKELL